MHHQLVTLGEAMLRLSVRPGDRIEDAAAFEVHVAGSEANVAYAAARVGLKSAWVSALPDNPLGHRVATALTAGGVDTSLVRWVPNARLGLYFVELASAPRPISVTYDRSGSAMARASVDDFDSRHRRRRGGQQGRLGQAPWPPRRHGGPRGRGRRVHRRPRVGPGRRLARARARARAGDERAEDEPSRRPVQAQRRRRQRADRERGPRGGSVSSDRLVSSRLIGIVRLDDLDLAVAAGTRAIDAGLEAVEVTFTLPSAAMAIERLRAARPGALIGAGTVRHTKDLEAAVAAGAQFLVAPGLNPDLVQAAQRAGITMLPGVFTPSEVDLALRLGANLLKLFPAEPTGPAYMAALLQPFPAARLVPTGGIGPENAAAYLKAGAVAVAMGSSLFPARRITSGGPEVVAPLVARALAAVTREVTR